MRHVESPNGVIRGKGTKEVRTNRVNLGLTLLSRRCLPGVPLTHDDIAAWCDVGAAAIWVIEQKALQKLRKRLACHRDPVLRELIEAIINS